MDKLELATDVHHLFRHEYRAGREQAEVEWRTCAPRPPWPGTLSSYIAVPAQYKAAVDAATKITVDDLEFVLSQTGESFTQGTDEAEEAVRRLEDFLDALKRI